MLRRIFTRLPTLQHSNAASPRLSVTIHTCALSCSTTTVPRSFDSYRFLARDGRLFSSSSSSSLSPLSPPASLATLSPFGMNNTRFFSTNNNDSDEEGGGDDDDWGEEDENYDEEDGDYEGEKEDDDWDENDFNAAAADDNNGTGLIKPPSDDSNALSYRVNNPNSSLFIDPGEYLEVQRRRRRELRGESEYKGPVTRDELMEEKMPGLLWHPRLIQVSQSSVTRKGGRVNSFRALIVIGNGRGSAGFGFGKGSNMKFAMEDATMKAYRDIVSIPLYENRTLHHDVLGKYNNVKVKMRSARPGYGLKAGPVLNAICDCFGLRDCVTRVHGGNNRYTVVHAAFKAFENYRSVENTALVRGQRLIDVNGLLENHYAHDLYSKWGDKVGGGGGGQGQGQGKKRKKPQFKLKN